MEVGRHEPQPLPHGPPYSKEKQRNIYKRNVENGKEKIKYENNKGMREVGLEHETWGREV